MKMEREKTMIIKKDYSKRINDHILIFDGAMGTSLQALDLTAANFGGESFTGCNDYLNLTCPDAVTTVHRSYLEAGAEVIETNTFRANRITLGEFGLADKVSEINYQGAQLARKCADDFSTTNKPCFVAGSMGPSSKLLSLATQEETEGIVSFDTIRNIFREQASMLINGGVDLLLIETAQDILEVKAAVLGIQEAFHETNICVPVQAQVTLDTNGLMLLGTDIQAALTILERLAIDVIGLNCSTGPKHMAAALAYLSQHSNLPISCLPNAGMPINENGKAVYPLTPDDFADQMAAFIDDFSLSVVGGCCGTNPAHIRALVSQVGKKKNKRRKVNHVPALSSAFHKMPLHQEPAPFIIGERLNTQGSRRFKHLMLEGDFQRAMQIAKEQAAGGAHALDICTALTEDDAEVLRTETMVKLLSNQIDLPLVIDSTDPDVMEAGLKTAPGRCLLNSVNLENGVEKALTILSLAKQHNAAVIALTIDENGMAKPADDKLSVAKRIYDLAVNECGLAPEAIIFDPLTFTLASGSSETASAAVETLGAIRLIKEALPACFTLLGISNVSFGLQKTAREVLNSVFLWHAVKAGLDLAILNPNQMKPYSAINAEAKFLAEELIHNRSTDALPAFIAYFESNQPDKPEKNTPVENPTIEEKIANHILNREREGLESDLDTYVHGASDNSKHKKALSALNDVLLPAMKEIGDQFGSGELILPFVLQSAEIMRAATDHLEQYLEKQGSTSKGTVILATVYGDVHDIGKNLTRTIIANNGFEVIDLGKQVPVETIIEKALEVNADAVGLSALLVSTSQQMRLVVDRLHKRGANIPILIGGAAVNQSFAERIVNNKDNIAFPGGVYYCRDAFDALKILSSLDREEKKQISHANLNTHKSKQKIQEKRKPAKNNIEHGNIPVPPFIGAKTIDIQIDTLFNHLNKPALYRIGWGAGKAKGDKWEKYQRDFANRLDRMRTVLEKHPWIQPKAAYGYWHCNSDGDSLLVYSDGKASTSPPLRLAMPRQSFNPNLCLSDYFAPRGKRQNDIVIFQLVTMGHKAVDFVNTLDDSGDLVEAFFAHGLAAQLTEAAAVYTHAQIRKELNIGKKRGKRYSWGYAPLPDLSQHADIVQLLNAPETMDIRLTSAFQFIPEYSTAAMVVHHPDTAYFQIENKG